MNINDEKSINFIKVLTNFYNNISRLELFIATVNLTISRKAKSILEQNVEKLILGLTYSQSNKDIEMINIEKFKSDLQKIGISFDSNKVNEMINQFEDHKFHVEQKELLKEVKMTREQSDHLYESSLISLITYFELLISNLIREYLEVNPYILNINEKHLTFELLSQLDSIDDALTHIKENEIEKLMYKGFKEWLVFLEQKIGIKEKLIGEEKDNINELINRRHLLIHNGGIVNTNYLKRVEIGDKNSDLKIGEKVVVDEQYLLKNLERIKRFGTILALNIWRSALKKSDYRLAYLIDSSYEFIKNEEYLLARYFSRFLETEKIDEDFKLLAKINYWQTYKWNDEFDKVKKEIEEFDFSAKAKKYQISKLALLDENQEIIDDIINRGLPEGIEVDDLQSWPLFTNLRKHEKYKDFISKLLNN